MSRWADNNRMAVRRHELLADLVTQVATRLAENEIPASLADLVANDLADHIAEHWGGQVITFPRDLRRKLTMLELEIYHNHFNGENYDDLARQYNMTVSGMRKLVDRIRKKLARRGQGDLFDPAASDPPPL
jgi:Uncharacterized conserved protein